MDDSTDARSMGALNAIDTAASASTSVSTRIWKAACVSGRVVLGGTAAVDAGRARAIAPKAITAPTPTARPVRARSDRRRIAPRRIGNTIGTARSATAYFRNMWTCCVAWGGVGATTHVTLGRDRRSG